MFATRFRLSSLLRATYLSQARLSAPKSSPSWSLRRQIFTPSALQNLIVDDLADRNTNVLVNARPGSGKTSTALSVADRYRGRRILFLTYSRRLRDITESKMQDLERSPGAEVEVETFHEMIGTLYKCQVDNDLLLRKLRLLGMQPNWDGVAPYDLIIIDEVQDMTPDLYWVSQVICSNPNGPKPQLLLLGDPHQMIYGYRDGDWRYIEEGDSIFNTNPPHIWKRRDLDISFRLTVPNATLANEYLGKEYVQASPRRWEAKLPMYIVYDRKDEGQVDKLLDILYAKIQDHRGVEDSDGSPSVAILSPYIDQNYPLIQLINQLSTEKGVLFAKTTEDDSSKDPQVLFGKVALSSFHAFKGAEAALTIVFGVDTSSAILRSAPSASTMSVDKHLLNPQFVGLTRAKKELIIVQSHSENPFPGITLDRLDKLTTFIDLTGQYKPKEKAKRRSNRPLRAAALVKHCSIDIQEKAFAEYLKVKQLSSPHLDQLPGFEPVVKTKIAPALYEGVGDLFGLAIVEAFQLHSQENRPNFDISYSKDDMKTIIDGVWKEHSRVSSLIFRKRQLHRTRWLDAASLAHATERLCQFIGAEDDLTFRVMATRELDLPGRPAVRIKGVADVVCHTTGSGKAPTLYAVKYKGQLGPEDCLQLVVNGMLQCAPPEVGHAERSFPRLILINIADGQVLEIQSDYERAEKLVKALVAARETPPMIGENSEGGKDSFAADCARIREEVEGASPFREIPQLRFWD